MESSWTESAVCLGCDPDMFHPERGEHEKNDRAMETCSICPVQTHCLDYAITEQLGVWGRWRAEHRAMIRRTHRGCPGCGSILLKGWTRLFCCDRCRDESMGDDHQWLTETRIAVVQEELAHLNRYRRRHTSDQPEAGPVPELAAA